MSDEPAILARIREALESALSPGQAAAVLLDALAHWGARVPSDLDELTSFVQGPLIASLGARAPASRTPRILRAIDDILANAAAPTQQHGVPAAWRDESTATVPQLDAPVPVLAIARGPALASRLRAALGPERIDARSAGDRGSIERALAAGPVVIIVDATDVPQVSAEELAPLLAATGASTVRVVWGSDLAYGRRVLELGETGDRPCSGLRLADGVESILDLVLSRRASTPPPA